MTTAPTTRAGTTPPARAEAAPAVPTPRAAAPPHPPARRRGLRLVLPVALGILALLLLGAAHHARPEPYGDRFTLHARVEDVAAASARVSVRTTGRGGVEAYDTVSGRKQWTYAREGHRALTLLSGPGHAVTLWDDGLVTDTARGGVRWHRAVPATARWLGTPQAHGGAGALRPLGREARILAVVTPHRIAAYRTADGDLRWTLSAREGCVFDPARAVRRGHTLLVAQPCRDRATAWTAQLVAVDDLGRVTPRRTPLGNDLPGAPEPPERPAAHAKTAP
ncbi:hypothetical protein GCM10010252_32900 [Streptomyces aureoverticillatus]|nr:hypothetical protein GCM10010252_32900 [Streptomyces aureoverticillatus]